MAEQSSQEKTEDATPKRLREARKKGQVYKSRDLETGVVLFAAFGILILMRSYMVGELQALMKLIFGAIGSQEIQMGFIYELVQASLITLVKVSAPFLLALMV